MDRPTLLAPCNPLETALVAAQKGEVPLAEFLAKLLDCDIVVPSATEVQADGSGLRPVLFDKEGTAMVAVFSSLDRAKKFEASARYALTISARVFLSGLSGEAGIVVNPGYAQGLDISPDGIKKILREFAKPVRG